MQDKSDIHWSHSHDFGIDNTHKTSKVKVVFWLTTIVMALEIIVGTWSGSMALLADGWHMGTHSAAFLITIFAYSYAKKHAKDKNFSFGTGKVNYLGGFASAVALALVALMMAIESIQRLIEPQEILFNEAIFVAIIGLAVNIASVFVLHDNGAHSHGHDHDHDHNMKAAYFHVLADTLTSILAIVALLAGKFFGWLWMDAMIGIAGAIVIARWSYGLIKGSSSVLLDKTAEIDTFDKIVKEITLDKSSVVSDLHVWDIGEAHQAAILSVTSQKPLNADAYKEILKAYLPKLSHVTVEINKP